VSVHVLPQRVCVPAQPDEHAKPAPEAAHRGVAPLHTTPHAPQLAVPLKSASQPLVAFPSQLAEPAAQAIPQRPATQVALAFVAPMHVVVQVPQWAVHLSLFSIVTETHSTVQSLQKMAQCR
jgi:hypothetical protein